MQDRNNTYEVDIGGVKIGSSNPIRVQSMTNTDTADTDTTVNQIMELYDAGSEIVRVTVNDEESAKNIPEIKTKLLQLNYNVPIVGDFHFNGHLLLSKYPETANILDKYRINPGNVGGKGKFDKNFEQIITIAIKNDKPIRIGGNWGSLQKTDLDEIIKQKEDFCPI